MADGPIYDDGELGADSQDLDGQKSGERKIEEAAQNLERLLSLALLDL